MSQRLSPEQLVKKWSRVLDHKDAPALQNWHNRRTMAQLLENQHNHITSAREILMEAAPTNVTGGMAKWDPVLISMVRRSAPQIIATDMVGVQAMTGPTGLIFAWKARYEDQTGAEALGLDEADTAWSGRSSDGSAGDDGSPVATDTEEDPFATTGSPPVAAYTVGRGHTTAQGENDITAKMAATIDSISVTAKTRSLATEYSTELAQDLRAMHQMDAEAEFSSILAQEMTAEINRELIRTIYIVAKPGAADTTTAGTFSLSADSDGRWLVETFKGLLYHIGKESNRIFFDTRRGKGNVLLVSADVAEALAQAGYLDYQSAMSGGTGVSNDVDMSTFAGTLQGRYRVHIDPYVTNSNYFVIGYRGPNAYDAGLYFCPYVPFQMYRAVDENAFHPKLAFKTRYGLVANPFVESAPDTPDAEAMTRDINSYYRKVQVTGI